MLRRLRKLYEWVLSWSEHPSGTWALFFIAMAEAIFFPIPPDPLLVLLCLGRPRRGGWYAVVCSAGSVAGGVIGFLVGWHFFAIVGGPIIRFYGLGARYEQMRVLFEQNNFLAIFAAGLTPIPYKVFTIAAGAFQVNFFVFLLASTASRSLRFFCQGLLVFWAGGAVKRFLEEWFEWAVTAFFVLLVLGFLAVRWLF